MLKGVSKNLSENYSQKIFSNHKEQLKNKNFEKLKPNFQILVGIKANL